MITELRDEYKLLQKHVCTLPNTEEVIGSLTHILSRHILMLVLNAYMRGKLDVEDLGKLMAICYDREFSFSQGLGILHTWREDLEP